MLIHWRKKVNKKKKKKKKTNHNFLDTKFDI